MHFDLSGAPKLCAGAPRIFSRKNQSCEWEKLVWSPRMGGYKIYKLKLESRDENGNQGQHDTWKHEAGQWIVSVCCSNALSSVADCQWLLLLNHTLEQRPLLLSTVTECSVDSALWCFGILWLNYDQDVHFFFSGCVEIRPQMMSKGIKKWVLQVKHD